MKPQPPSTSVSETKSDSSSTPLKSNLGDNHDDLEHIEIKLDKNLDEQSTITTQKSSINNKHSPNNNPNSTASGGFSLKNPVSSFRSWVSNKKSSKEDPTSTEQSATTPYKKIDTSPTPRKSSLESDSTKRTRTNSATVTTKNSYHQENDTNTSSTRVKKKSSFSLRTNNAVSLIKRPSDTPTNSNETEQTGAGNSPFGYFKNLVRGEKQ